MGDCDVRPVADLAELESLMQRSVDGAVSFYRDHPEFYSGDIETIGFAYKSIVPGASMELTNVQLEHILNLATIGHSVVTWNMAKMGLLGGGPSS